MRLIGFLAGLGVMALGFAMLYGLVELADWIVEHT